MTIMDNYLLLRFDSTTSLLKLFINMNIILLYTTNFLSTTYLKAPYENSLVKSDRV